MHYKTWLRTHDKSRTSVTKLQWLRENKLPHLIRKYRRKKIMMEYCKALLGYLDQLDKKVDNGEIGEDKLKQHLSVTDRKISTLVVMNVSGQNYNKQIELAIKAQDLLGVDGRLYMPPAVPQLTVDRNN